MMSFKYASKAKVKCQQDHLMLGLRTKANEMMKKTRVVTALIYSLASGPLT